MVIITKKDNYFKFLPALLVSFVLFKIVFNSSSYLGSVLKIINPFIWAFGIAYLLNPLMSYLEKKLKLKRIWIILIVYMIFVGLLFLIVTIITPTIVTNIGALVKDIPNYANETERWFYYQINRLGTLEKYNLTSSLENILSSTLQKLNTTINPILNATFTQALSITSGIYNIIMGLLISVYILKDKEIFNIYVKKLLYTFVKKDTSDNILSYIHEFNDIFSKFLIGKIIDSSIIGLLCFVGASLIGVPYALMIAVIVGITNMIPYFGPLIGMVPAVIITLFYDPIIALELLIFILALQQFDGLYLGPKIMGTKVGLSPVLVISVIIIGGSLFGVLGMFLAVPIGATIKVILERYVDRSLKMKNIVIK